MPLLTDFNDHTSRKSTCYPV